MCRIDLPPIPDELWDENLRIADMYFRATEGADLDKKILEEIIEEHASDEYKAFHRERARLRREAEAEMLAIA